MTTRQINGPAIWGDWGSSRLRLWLVDDGVVLERKDGPGIGTLSLSPAETLGAIIAPWLERGGVQHINLCGMVGARGALHEVAYVDCPANLGEWRASAAQSSFGAIPLRIAAGVACRSEDGVPDVMRGEETQLFGAIALHPALGEGRQRVVLPGTHSKWIWLDQGRIIGFRTFLTGELFGLLQQSSLLRAADGADCEDETEGFTAGILRAQRASGVLGSLFEARAAQLRDGRSASWASGFLSGLVIGSEVREMVEGQEDFERGQVTIIGDPQLAARYELALGGQGFTMQRVDGDACAIAGLGLLDADD